MFTSKTRSSVAGLLFACAIGLFAHTVLSGESKRTELKRTDLAGSGNTEVIMSTLELESGAAVPLHYHHGEEYLYVLEGGSVRMPDGKVTNFEPGMTLHFTREQVHGGFTATGSSTLKVLTVHIVDKGKPLYVPVE